MPGVTARNIDKIMRSVRNIRVRTGGAGRGAGGATDPAGQELADLGLAALQDLMGKDNGLKLFEFFRAKVN